MREIIKEELSKIDVRKMSFDRCINNIIVILENYKTLKQFTIQVENVKFSKEEIDQAKQKELEKMMEEVFSSKEIYLESVYKKHLQTKLFLNFLESTFKEYIKETEISMKPKSELKIARGSISLLSCVISIDKSITILTSPPFYNNIISFYFPLCLYL